MRYVRFIAAAIAAATLCVTATPAAAQKPVRIGVSGGLSLPTAGDMSDAVNTGFALNANLGFPITGTSLTWQIEGGINRWGYKNSTGIDGSMRLVNLSGNLLYDFPTASPVRPYVLGTAGLYHLTASVDTGNSTVSSSTNKFGLGFGAGIRMPLSGLDTYLEARFQHALDTEVSFIPITFGIRF